MNAMDKQTVGERYRGQWAAPRPAIHVRGLARNCCHCVDVSRHARCGSTRPALPTIGPQSHAETVKRAECRTLVPTQDGFCEGIRQSERLNGESSDQGETILRNAVL